MRSDPGAGRRRPARRPTRLEARQQRRTQLFTTRFADATTPADQLTAAYYLFLGALTDAGETAGRRETEQLVRHLTEAAGRLHQQTATQARRTAR